MSDNQTTEAAAANTEAAEITTLNSHATIQPVKLSPVSGDGTTGEATPDNSHATDETV
ncbi:hypothetical protein [Streptomyces dangxiongensis]|uniref:hypothetical protein n=1 Tax=Streptomyces dangxiongensis TaxID=1442032 RepID=UPI0013CEDCE7|nr:hypothetical protein [Streptomyces dangxiongensis]